MTVPISVRSPLLTSRTTAVPDFPSVRTSKQQRNYPSDDYKLHNNISTTMAAQAESSHCILESSPRVPTPAKQLQVKKRVVNLVNPAGVLFASFQHVWSVT